MSDAGQSPGHCATPDLLSESIAAWVTERTEAILKRFFSGPVLPRFNIGHIMGPDAYSDLMRLLGHLHALGVAEIAGVTMEDWIRRILPGIDGERTQTFGSLALAETLLEWGPFDGNPLLKGFSGAQCANLADACDTTHIYREDGTIGEWSANYWMVLARSEHARQRLGLLRDSRILEAALARCRLLLQQPADRYFDDSATGVGRYDSYSMGSMSILRPLAHLLPEGALRAWLIRDVRLLETLAMENGGCVVYGRSIGLLSITSTLGQAAAALRDGLGEDPGRLMALAAHAWEQVPGWYQDDLVAAHRDRMTDGYRGPQRLLQMSLDCLSSLAGIAQGLRGLPPVPAPRGVIFPPRDEVIRFDQRNAGVWMFRNAHLSFQLPFVSAWLGSDYTSWLHSPGLFENPWDCPIRFGVPVALLNGKAFGPGELPASVTTFPGGLTLTYDSLMEEVAGGWMPNPAWRWLAAKLTLTWRVEGECVHLEQRLELPQRPDGLAIHIPQARRPLVVEVESCNVPFSQNTVVVEGMGQYRSCWGQLTAVHELHLEPSMNVCVHWTVRSTSIQG
jgi:hypothetical protein